MNFHLIDDLIKSGTDARGGIYEADTHNNVTN